MRGALLTDHTLQQGWGCSERSCTGWTWRYIYLTIMGGWVFTRSKRVRAAQGHHQQQSSTPRLELPVSNAKWMQKPVICCVSRLQSLMAATS